MVNLIKKNVSKNSRLTFKKVQMTELSGNHQNIVFLYPDTIHIIIMYCDCTDIIKISMVSKIFKKTIGEEYIKEQKRIYIEQKEIIREYTKLLNMEKQIQKYISTYFDRQKMNIIKIKIFDLYLKINNKFSQKKYVEIENRNIKDLIQLGRKNHKDQRFLLSKLTQKNLQYINNIYHCKLHNIFFETIIHSDYDLLLKIHKINPEFLEYKNSYQFISACKSSDLNIVKLLYNNIEIDDTFIKKGFMIACLYKNYNVVNWMKESYMISDQELINISLSDNFDINSYIYLKNKYFGNFFEY